MDLYLFTSGYSTRLFYEYMSSCEDAQVGAVVQWGGGGGRRTGVGNTREGEGGGWVGGGARYMRPVHAQVNACWAAVLQGRIQNKRERGESNAQQQESVMYFYATYSQALGAAVARVGAQYP